MGADKPLSPLDHFLSRLQAVTPSGPGFMARCPSHDDTNPSLSITEGSDGRVLLHCHAGCTPEQVVTALGLTMKDLFLGESGLTLAQYAEAKRLPIEFLRTLGLEEIRIGGRPAVRIPYFDEQGREVAIRFRLALQGSGAFRWKKGSKVCPYGLWRLAQARQAGYIVLVEGESDAHTLWCHSIPALGLPGADTWQASWAAHLDSIPKIYVVIEPDTGGQTVLRWLAVS